jgi:hypothetical protein
MSTLLRKPRSILLEFLPVAALVLLSAYCGAFMLRGWNGPALTLTNELYIPAALYAQGRGFIQPPLDELPGLREFLYFPRDTPAWTPETLPETFSKTEMDTYERYHRYLIYSMGIVWRLFGVSWDAAKILVIGVYTATVLAAYAMMRVGLGRPLALLGAAAFAFSPAVLDILYNVRDFSKGPFILALLGLLLYVLRETRPRRRWFAACAALGVVVGIGLGFRRDLMVCPPAVLAVLLIAPRPAAGALTDRAGGIVCFTLAAVICALPILESFRERGSLVYHDALMGTATEHDARIGLGLASYEKSPLKHDLYLATTADLFTERVIGPPISTPYVASAFNYSRFYFWSLVEMFPADFIARSWQAVIRVSEGVASAAYFERHPLAFLHGAGKAWVTFAERCGPMAVLLALLLMAAADLRFALAAAALFAYFGGITSLQYETRHAFHMLAPAFGLYLVPLQYAVNMWRGRATGRPVLLGVGLRRAVVCAAVMAGAVLLPLFAASALQHAHMADFEERLTQAPVEPIPVTAEPIEFGTLYRPDPPLVIGADIPYELSRRPMSEYLMVELEAYAAPMPIYIAYESTWGRHDFGGFLRVWPCKGEPGGPVRYYFPAIECRDGRDWTRFVGIGFRSEDGNPLRGLYRVVDGASFDFHLNIALADNPERRLRRQPLRVPWFDEMPKAWISPMGLHHPMLEASRAFQLDDIAGARAKIAEFKFGAVFPMEVLSAEAEIVGAEQGFDAYFARLTEGMRRWPKDFSLALSAHNIMISRHTLDERLAYWRQATEAAPGAVAPWMMLGFTLAANRQYADAGAAFERVKEIAGSKFGIDALIERAALRVEQQSTGQEPGGF